jgi:hypothetical protein
MASFIALEATAGLGAGDVLLATSDRSSSKRQAREHSHKPRRS